MDKLQYSVLELTVAEIGGGSKIVLCSAESRNRVSFDLVRNGVDTNLANIVVRRVEHGGDRDVVPPMCFVHFKQRGAYRMRDMLMVGPGGYVYELEYDGGSDRPFHSHNPLLVSKSLWRSDYLYKTVGAYPHSEGGFVFVVPKTVIAFDSVATNSVATNSVANSNNQTTGRTITGSDSVTGSESLHCDWLDSPFRFDANEFNSVDDVKAYLSDSKTVNVCICLSQDGCRIKTVSRYRPSEHRQHSAYKPFPVYVECPESVNDITVGYDELGL